MWNVNPPLDENYGPDFGVDYARFSDPPDLKKDYLMQKLVEMQLAHHENAQEISVSSRNGFIILKGKVPTEDMRNDITDFVRTIPGVVEVINQIAVNEHH